MIAMLLSLGVGCTDTKSGCETNTDCQTGLCSPDGECVDILADTATDLDTAELDDTASETDTGTTVCQPNADGILSWNEYPSTLDLAVPFYHSANSPINLVGSSSANGREWDFSQTISGQSTVIVDTPTPSGFWFTDRFPSSSYVTVLSRQNDLYGIFTLTEQGLWLDGVASFDSGWTETLLVYDPPAQILQFPFAKGDTWTTESVVTGTLNGVYSYHLETQSVTVDASGHLEAPLGRFPVLRVHTETTREVGVLTYVSQSMAFVAECYGIVTTASSDMDETQAEFDTAFELLRMAPQ